MTEQEKELSRRCLRLTLEQGADGVRVSQMRQIRNKVSILDGQVDGTRYSQKRCIILAIFAGSRCGMFRTNVLDEESLRDFIAKSVKMTRLMTPDSAHHLPPLECKATGCAEASALGLCDALYNDFPAEERIATALQAASNTLTSDKWELLSCECDWDDDFYEEYLIDSDGFEGLHRETTFGFNAEVTIEGADGKKYSAEEWDCTLFRKDLDPSTIVPRAIEKAVSQMNPIEIGGGIMDVVVDRSCASKITRPVVDALDVEDMDQKRSFLEGSLGKKIFSVNLTLDDLAIEKGRIGSRLFDNEGLACSNRTIIGNGVVKLHTASAYIAAKKGISPVCAVQRPSIRSFLGPGLDGKGTNAVDLMARCGNGVYITNFIGGNCNQATGQFSFGAEGFIIENGHKGAPVKGLVMTGNMVELWNSLAAAADDARKASVWQIPSLLFTGVKIDS